MFRTETRLTGAGDLFFSGERRSERFAEPRRRDPAEEALEVLDVVELPLLEEVDELVEEALVERERRTILKLKSLELYNHVESKLIYGNSSISFRTEVGGNYKLLYEDHKSSNS